MLTFGIEWSVPVLWLARLTKIVIVFTVAYIMIETIWPMFLKGNTLLQLVYTIAGYCYSLYLKWFEHPIQEVHDYWFSVLSVKRVYDNYRMAVDL